MLREGPIHSDGLSSLYNTNLLRSPRSPNIIGSRAVGRGGIKFMGRTISGIAPALADFPEDRDWGYHDDGTTVYLVYNRLGVINSIPLVDLATQAELDARVPNVAWASWTPTWTNLTVGDGTVVARFTQIGKLVVARISIVFGSTTAITGTVSFSFPVTRAAYPGTVGLHPIGVARFLDSGTAAFEGHVTSLSTTAVAIQVLGSAGTYVNALVLSSTVPFTWGTADEIAATFSYEAA